MILKTKHFGKIEIREQDIINFADGIPGFEKLSQYVIIENPEEDIPFRWLQCIDDSSLAFVIIDPFVFKNDYEFDMPQNAIEKLHIKSHKDINIYTIVVVPEDIKEMTANLAAPIVINTANKKGKQVFLEDDRYHRRHLILEEIKKSAPANKDLEKQNTAVTEGGR
ncbi:MAG TPA: flagellar assembly protein FliW [Clostridia bacterium]|nr:flagellar assembly protein FliW [Clostridia bacterium]